MAANPIIRVEHLGKSYRLGQAQSYYAFRDRLANLFKSDKKMVEPPFWALKDISFDIQAGDAVGIIGRNGAGKSTLLKILSRITPPTEGRIELNGRVASLLEVGTGFHPELTGRENIYLNGAVLGMVQSEIRKKFDEIVAFAEIEAFLDTPVKRYSSGMYVRLAFAVAAHLNPEILVVDEVLAVGDAQFQAKCLSKMGEFGQSGRTVLFVSHNMAAIQSLCTSAIMLNQGHLDSIGPVDAQIARYLDRQRQTDRRSTKAIRLKNGLQLSNIRITPQPVVSGDAVTYRFTLLAREDTVLDGLGLLIQSSLNVKTAFLDLRQGVPYKLVAGTRLEVTGSVRHLPLVEGDYSFMLYLRDSDGIEEHVADVATIGVHGRTSKSLVVPYPAAARGVVELDSNFSAEVKKGRFGSTKG